MKKKIAFILGAILIIAVIFCILINNNGSDGEVLVTASPEVTAEPIVDVSPEATEEVTAKATADATPEATEEVTKEATADVTSEATKDATPEATEEVTAEATADVTPEVTKEATPEATEKATEKVTPEVTEEPTATAAPESSDDVKTTFTITVESGTTNCYTYSDSTLTFTNVSEDTVVTISGSLEGNIVIDPGDEYKFELDLSGFTLTSDSVCPIVISSGDSVTISAKKNTKNYIYDKRSAVDSESEDPSASVFSAADLKINGQGSLTVTSDNNNGIHSKGDLEVKNVTLNVTAVDNALKGNDSVTITDSKSTTNIMLISKQGDGIKTTNSDISTKGNQRGIVTIDAGTVTIYAACDGIDAAYNAEISGNAVVNIYTDKYSSYSEDVTVVSGSEIYIKTTSKTYNYSIKYYNSSTDYKWVNLSYYTSASSSSGMGGPRGRSTTYYYYKGEAPSGYSYMSVYAYTSSQTQGQDTTFYASKTGFTVNQNYDTIQVSVSSSSISASWTTYSQTSGGYPGGGGMGGDTGNTDKGEYSTKGIKAANEILISGGTVTIKSYDDAIHANNESELENGETPSGNVIISGGTLSLYSNDDGIHADGNVTISGGKIDVTNAYEGVEGVQITVSGGSIYVKSSDDGFNSTATSGSGITINGGYIYIYAGGDGMDSNSRTSSVGINFNGGDVVVISTSSNNSSIDTEQGYTYKGGTVLALCPSGGMGSEATNCSGFSSVGKSSKLSLTASSYVTATVSGTVTAAVKMPCSLSALVVYLGSSSATLAKATSVSVTLDSYGVYFSEK